MAPTASKRAFLGAVTLLRFSSSGALLYVGVGPSLFVYDVVSGVLLCERLALSRGILHGCDVTEDGSVGAFFGQKRVACFEMLPQQAQDVEGGFLAPIGKQRVFRDWVFDVRALPEDKLRLAVGFAHNFVQIWDPLDNRIERTVQCGERCILYSLAFHGRALEELVVAAGTVFQHILLWNPVGNDESEVVMPAQRLHAHDGVIFKLTWSTDARQLASVSDDRTVQLWSNVSPSEEHNAKPLGRDKLLATPFAPVFRSWGHSARVWDVQFCGSDRLATTSEDGVCKVWNVEGECLASLTGHMGKHVWRVAVQQPANPSTSALIATGGGDGAVKLWDVEQQIWATTTATFECPDVASIHGHSRTISILHSEVVGEMNAKGKGPTNSIRNILVNPIDGGATAFVATEHGEFFRVSLDSSEWTRFFVIPAREANENGGFGGLSTCSLSKNGQFLVGGDVAGRVLVVDTATGEVVFSWVAHERSRIMKIWWLDDDTVFTGSADGMLKEWKPTGDSSALDCMTHIASFKCPGRCSVTSLVVLDLANTAARSIVCGDGRGSIFVFHSVPSTSSDKNKPLAPVEIRKAVHGREQVSTLLLDTSSRLDHLRLFSGGHDGSICSFLVNVDHSGTPSLRLVARDAVKGLATVKELSWFSPPGSSDRELLVFGFHAANAVLYNFSAQYRVFNFSCGGWRRPHALLLKPASSTALPSHSFVFTPSIPQKGNLGVNITVHSSEASNIASFRRASLHDHFHGKMTTCVAFVDSQRIVTAAEDNSLMLHTRRGEDDRWTSVSSGVAHTTTVRALVSFRGSNGETLLVSGGGKQRVNVWRVADAGKATANVLQFVCGHEPSGAVQDHRILCLTTFGVSHDKFRLVAGGNSEGGIPLLLVDAENESVAQIGELTLPSKKPILSCVGVQHNIDGNREVSLLAVGSTDGLVSLFNLSSWMEQLQHVLTSGEGIGDRLKSSASDLQPASSFLAHDMGVNCMCAAESDSFHPFVSLLSGGDDQNLRLSDINLSTWTLERHVSVTNASGSAIKAVASTGDAVYIGGYDQRVSLFRISRNEEVPALEWQCSAFSECADIADVAIQPGSGETVVVVGQGLQTISFGY